MAAAERRAIGDGLEAWSEPEQEVELPELCRFFGIIIRMYREIGGPHHQSHIHANYGSNDAVFSIETAELIAGTLPKKERKLVEAWIEMRKSELRINWAQLNTAKGRPAFFKIEPLK
jgi:hypothetical protein